jgi:hypothetical protein
MNAILVVVFINAAGGAPFMHHYPFASMDACERAIKASWVRAVNPDDGRGVQALFCIEAKSNWNAP